MSVRHTLLASAFACAAALMAIAADGPSTPNAPHIMKPADQTDYVFDVTVKGSGQDILLIPGLASPATVWDGTAAHLSRDYRVHTLGLHGFGGLTASGTDAPIFEAALQDIQTYMTQNDLQNVTVIGHSLGGMLGLTLARDSDRIGRAVIVDALPFYPALFDPAATVETSRPMTDRMLSALSAAEPAQFAQMQRRGAAIYAKSPEDVARIGEWSAASDQVTVTSAMRSLLTTDLRPDLPSIATPVDVIYAYDPAMGRSSDAVTELWTSQYAGLPNAGLTRIDGSYHFIMFDQPEAFFGALDTALTGEK